LPVLLAAPHHLVGEPPRRGHLVPPPVPRRLGGGGAAAGGGTLRAPLRAAPLPAAQATRPRPRLDRGISSPAPRARLSVAWPPGRGSGRRPLARRRGAHRARGTLGRPVPPRTGPRTPHRRGSRAMSRPSAPAGLSEPPVERRDATASVVWTIAALLFLHTVVAGTALFGLYELFAARRAASLPPPAPVQSSRTVPPEPLLQVDAREDLRLVLEEQRRLLHSWEW